MPTTRKPRRDYRPVSIFTEDDGIRCYDEAAVKRLAEEFGLAAEKGLEELSERLEGAALVYRVYHSNEDDGPTTAEVKAALANVRKHAAKLEEALKEIDPRSAWHLWRFDSEVEAQASRLDAIGTASETTRFGHSITRMQIDAETTVIDRLEPKKLVEAVSVLRNYAAEAISALPESEAGRKSSEALRMWIANADGVWRDFTDKPFTLKRHKGQPATDAAAFCVQAFAPVDPNVPASAVMNEMEKRIKKRRDR